jgi:membrane fusion protein, multidrug efflux system
MRPRWWIFLVVVAALIALGATTLRRPSSAARAGADNAAPGGGRAGRGGAGMSVAIPIVAAPVTARDVPIYLEGLGTVIAYNTVTIKSRVDGELVKVNFREGDEVKAGQVLAQIDSRPFEVQLHQAEATLARDQAQLTDAQANLQRYEKLGQAGVLAQQQVDTQRAQVGQLQGTLGADRAQIESARLQLTYTRITAPIPGRIGLRLVDPGNIVHASDQSGLLVITQLHPIAVLFSLPEDVLPSILKQMKKGALPVDAYTRDDTQKVASGKLLTINNQIDPTTGTDKLKAVFENSDSSLWPNQFVNIHLLLDVKKNALTVPVAGVQHGSQGSYAYVVKPDKTVEVRNITPGITEGNLATIDAGLQAGELVVTDGQDKLQPGSKVEVRQPGAGGGGNGSMRGQGAYAGRGSNGGAPGAGPASPPAESGQNTNPSGQRGNWDGNANGENPAGQGGRGKSGGRGGQDSSGGHRRPQGAGPSGTP